MGNDQRDAYLYREGLGMVARGWSGWSGWSAAEPLEPTERIAHLEGMREIDLSLLAPLASLQDAGPFNRSTRGFRCTPTPGYLLQPLRGIAA